MRVTPNENIGTDVSNNSFDQKISNRRQWSVQWNELFERSKVKTVKRFRGYLVPITDVIQTVILLIYFFIYFTVKKGNLDNILLQNIFFMKLG